MQNFSLEFILNTHDGQAEIIKQSLVEFGEELEVLSMQEQAGSGNNFQVKIRTQDPTIIFDLCAQFGRIASVKINESH